MHTSCSSATCFSCNEDVNFGGIINPRAITNAYVCLVSEDLFAPLDNDSNDGFNNYPAVALAAVLFQIYHSA